MATAQGAEWDKLGQLSLSDGDQTMPPSEQQESKAAASGDEGVDMAIKGALQGPERSIVLQIEEQVEAFVRDQTPDVLEFPSNFSNYQRMLAHKVAQHYKLQTSTVGYEAGQGRVVAKRTAWAAAPAVKLADLDVKAFKGPMPTAKALIRRPNSGDLGGHRSTSQGANDQAATAPKTHKEREDEYNAARERIIGKQGGQQMQQQGQGQGQQQGQQQQQQQGQPAGATGVPSGVADGGYSSGGSSGSALTSAASLGRGGSGERGRGFANTANAGRGAANGRGRGAAVAAAGAGAAAAAGGVAGAGAGRGGKAVYRDRDRDVQDPDYRRGVSRYQPRFDPGYGPQMQGMYAIPSYGSEFPAMHNPTAAAGPGAAPGTAYPAGAMPMHGMYSHYPVAMPSFRPPPPPPPGAAPASPHTGAAGDAGVTGYAPGQPVPMGSMAMGMGARPYGTMLGPVPMQAMQMGYHGVPHGAIPVHAGGPGGGHPAMYGGAHPMHMTHMVPASYGYMQGQMGEGTMMAMTAQGPVPVYAAGGYHPGMHPYQQAFPPAHMQQLSRANSTSVAAGGADGDRGGQALNPKPAPGQQGGRGGYSSSGSSSQADGRGGSSGSGGGGKKEGKAATPQQ